MNTFIFSGSSAKSAVASFMFASEHDNFETVFSIELKLVIHTKCIDFGGCKSQSFSFSFYKNTKKKKKEKRILIYYDIV